MGYETLGYALAAIAAAGSVYAASQTPDAPQMPQAEKLPQASKAPNSESVRKRILGGPLAGVPATLLTGGGGVDPSGLSLGKTLLGM